MDELEKFSEKLGQFGLNKVDARIYFYLLHKQPQTILDISRALGIPRPTVYDSSFRLIGKGLIEKVISHKSQKLQAFPLTILQTALDREKETIALLQKDLDFIEKHTP